MGCVCVCVRDFGVIGLCSGEVPVSQALASLITEECISSLH